MGPPSGRSHLPVPLLRLPGGFQLSTAPGRSCCVADCAGPCWPCCSEHERSAREVSADHSNRLLSSCSPCCCPEKDHSRAAEVVMRSVLASESHTSHPLPPHPTPEQLAAAVARHEGALTRLQKSFHETAERVTFLENQLAVGAAPAGGTVFGAGHGERLHFLEKAMSRLSLIDEPTEDVEQHGSDPTYEGDHRLMRRSSEPAVGRDRSIGREKVTSKTDEKLAREQRSLPKSGPIYQCMSLIRSALTDQRAEMLKDIAKAVRASQQQFEESLSKAQLSLQEQVRALEHEFEVDRASRAEEILNDRAVRSEEHAADLLRDHNLVELIHQMVVPVPLPDPKDVTDPSSVHVTGSAIRPESPPMHMPLQLRKELMHSAPSHDAQPGTSQPSESRHCAACCTSGPPCHSREEHAHPAIHRTISVASTTASPRSDAGGGCFLRNLSRAVGAGQAQHPGP